MSFLHLAKSFREVLGTKDIASNLLKELDSIDIKSVGAQAVYTTVDCAKDHMEIHVECKVYLFLEIVFVSDNTHKFYSCAQN